MRAVVGHAEKEENSLVYIHCVYKCRLSKVFSYLSNYTYTCITTQTAVDCSC